MEDKVFFADKAYEGIKLTSTSANHVANLAKEFIQTIESQLQGVSFLNVTVGLVSSDVQKQIQIGKDKQMIDGIPQMLEQIAQAKSLIAWLREAIKSKENLIHDLNLLSFDNWCKLVGKEVPVVAKLPAQLTEDEYYASLPIKERNRYYHLETTAAVIGKYIHNNGEFSIKRKELKNKLEHPYEVDGKGQDALIYSYTPSASVEDVDNMFFELQKKHREVQSQLNSMKHECQIALDKSTNAYNAAKTIAFDEYSDKISAIRSEMQKWIDEKTQEYSQLKIIIPNSLIDIYNVVNTLGK